MSNRNGRYVAALGGLALSLSLLGGQAIAKADGQRETPQGAQKGAQAPSQAEAAKWYRSPTKSDCEYPQSGETETLCLGRRSAIASEAQAAAGNGWAARQYGIAWWQIGLNLAALIGVFYTVFYAHHAWKQAMRSADAAHQALDHAQADSTEQATRFATQLEVANQSVDAALAAANASNQAARWMRSAANAAHRQVALAEHAATVMERPYVFFHDTQRLGPEPDPGLAVFPPNTFRIVWKNFGKTPAFVTGIRLGLSHEDEGSDPATMPKHDMPFGAVIGVGDEWRRGQIVVTPDMMRDLKEDARPIWLCAEITYRDLHGQDHRTWFCRFYVGLGFILEDSCDPAFNGYK